MSNKSCFSNIERLSIPEKVCKDLETFLCQISDLYKEDLISIIAFGSCVTGDYSERRSDVNLLVVYSDLNIADIERVADFARQWHDRRNFVPRFLSKRNLVQSAKFFQVDLVQMKDANIVLFGEDILAGIELSKPDLHWQTSYQIKAMRMRIKQQFWRAGNNDIAMRRILIARFVSLIHLSRCILIMKGEQPPVSHSGIMSLSVQKLGLDKNYVDKAFALRENNLKFSRSALHEMFVHSMEAIRTLDEILEKIKL